MKILIALIMVSLFVGCTDNQETTNEANESTYIPPPPTAKEVEIINSMSSKLPLPKTQKYPSIMFYDLHTDKEIIAALKVLEHSYIPPLKPPEIKKPVVFMSYDKIKNETDITFFENERAYKFNKDYSSQMKTITAPDFDFYITKGVEDVRPISTRLKEIAIQHELKDNLSEKFLYSLIATKFSVTTNLNSDSPSMEYILKLNPQEINQALYPGETLTIKENLCGPRAVLLAALFKAQYPQSQIQIIGIKRFTDGFNHAAVLFDGVLYDPTAGSGGVFIDNTTISRFIIINNETVSIIYQNATINTPAYKLLALYNENYNPGWVVLNTVSGVALEISSAGTKYNLMVG